MKGKITMFILFAFLNAEAVISQANKFGYISSSQLLSIMPESKEAERKLRIEVEKLEEELNKLNVEYQNKLQNYMDEQESLTTAVRQLRERELLELQNRIQEFHAGSQEIIQQRRRELMQPIFEKIENVISDVAREKAYYFVFDLDSSGILYFSDETEDILPLVKERLGL